MRHDKGIAGLQIILSIVVMLFIIGLLVMIFTIMGAQVMDTDTIWRRSATHTVVNETLTTVDTIAGENFSVVNLRDVACIVVAVYNGTPKELIATANYTQSNCNLANATLDFSTHDWTVTYTHTHLYDPGSIKTINDTMLSIDDVIT